MPRLLIVKTSSLGDVVHNLPVVADIHAAMPGVVIDWLVEEGFADVPALHPGVAEVIPLAARRWKKSPLSRATWREITGLRQKLRARRYDWVLDTQGLLKSALVAAWAVGERHGYDWHSAREPLATLFYHQRHAVARGQHAVTRNRQLAARALGYAMPHDLPDYGIRPAATPVPGLPSRYVVGLHATSRVSKLWPTEHWIALGKALSGQGLSLVLPWGNAAERSRAQAIATKVPQTVVLPRLRLAQLSAVLGGAVAAVGVDTGLVHLAAALDIPTVAIHTDTQPALTGVLAPRPGRCLDLGGVGQLPSCDAVLKALLQVVSPLHLGL
ncbi:MAG: lipopolysaccharide heptosyltransferase I [Methylophilaceae bacterium]|nr:lipopolysaccharide heptosyltransferase I [Methylophilaceae bacterium]